MQDSKEITWASDYSAEHESAEQEPDQKITQPDTDSPAGSADSDGWQQYRRWISKAPAPRRRRSSIDPSLYTWKGYRNWTEQVKRNWSDD